MDHSTNIFEGHKVRLRAFTAEDVDVLWQQHGSDTEAERLAGAPEFPRSRKHFEDFVNARLDYTYDHDNYHLAVETLDGEFVGHVCSMGAFRRMGSFGLGVHLFRPFWGNGYGTESAALLLRFFFRELRYHSCSSSCWEFNEASQALHRKLGFREIGRRKERVFHNNKRYDEILWDMTKDEFLDVPINLPPVAFYEDPP